MAGTRDCGLDTSAETGDGKQLDDYFTLTDLVQGNTLVAKPSPLQIIRNPAVPDLFAVVTNVVCTYKIVGPKGEKLSLNRQAVADVARVKMGLSCDFKKPGALTTNFTIHGADHHPKPMMYHTSATHQLAAHTPEDALLVAHTFTHELSKLFGIRVRPSPINIHNIVTVMDAGRRLNRDLITEVTHGYVSTDDIASKSKNTRKRFPGQIVYSRRVPPVVFLFFESGQVTSCGAMTREHVQIGLEEVDEILQKQLQLAIRANPDDLQLARSTRDVINKEQSLAHANKLIARTLSTPHKRPERTFLYFFTVQLLHVFARMWPVSYSYKFHVFQFTCSSVRLLSSSFGLFVLN